MIFSPVRGTLRKALTLAASSGAQVPPILDHVGIDPSIFSRIVENSSHVVRLEENEENVDSSLASYLEHIQSPGVLASSVKRGIRGFFSANNRYEESIPLDVGHGRTISASITTNLRIDGYEALLENGHRLAKGIVDNVSHDAVITSMNFFGISEDDILRGGAGFTKFAPHYDVFAPIPEFGIKSDKEPISFTFLQSHIGLGTMFAKGERLREAFTEALDLERGNNAQRVIIDGINNCGYSDLMRLGSNIVNLNRNSLSFGNDRPTFWDSANIGEVILFKELPTLRKHTASDYVCGLHSSPSMTAGMRVFTLGRGFFFK